MTEVNLNELKIDLTALETIQLPDEVVTAVSSRLEFHEGTLEVLEYRVGEGRVKNHYLYMCVRKDGKLIHLVQAIWCIFIRNNHLSWLEVDVIDVWDFYTYGRLLPELIKPVG